MSPIEKLELPPKQRAANEADTVWAMLDFYRTTLVRKCAGLSDDDLRSRATLAAFYESQGATLVGTAKSKSTGRDLPLFELRT